MPDELPPICIIPTCGKPSRWRGLCSRCYGAAKSHIDAGKTTWEQLYDLGLAINDTPFALANAKATAEATL